MKTLDEIYNDLKKDFYKNTDIDIEEGTVIDYYNLSVSSMIEKTYEEIENNKTPHIYSSLSGDKLDNIGILCGIARRPNESDKNYSYRILNWNVSNKAANTTSIETALMDLEYASHVTYIPFVFGCGTAAAYIIPKNMNNDIKTLAVQEAKSRLSKVISPSTYIEYIIPKIRKIDLVLLIKSELSDLLTIKELIANDIIKYINNIAPGDYLQIGEINRIGINELNVNYFSVGHLFINDEETGIVSSLQKVESKFLISKENITWLEVE